VENGFSQNHEIQTIKPVFAGDRTEVAASFSIRSEVGGDETSTAAENGVDFDSSSREMLWPEVGQKGTAAVTPGILGVTA